ncbi:MAG: hypothetical protein B6D61_12435 [Bacteroidetes bacterium 4484_249]|nr:MAG: hypothetical protein B6D61_12435 [Bacteroidetes bacterium 4484_249]
MLINLSKDYLYQQPQKAIELANEALEISISIKDLKRQASSLYCIADGYRVIGENIKSLDYFLQSLKTFKDVSDKEGIARCANSIGLIYRFLGDYPAALDYHLNALRIYEELGDNVGIASSMINTGVVYRNLGEKDIALDNYEKALKISRKNNDLINTVSALVSTGNIYWYNNENTKSLKYYEEALEISQQDDFKGDNTAGILNNIGNVNRSEGKYNEALEYYNKSLQISKKIGDKNLIAVTLKNIGIVKKNSGKLSQAIEYFNKSLKLSQQIHLLRIQRETLDQLSQTYTLLADYKKALEYHIEYSKLKDSLYDEETSSKISMLQLSHEKKETEQQNTIKEKDLELKISRERNIRNFIILISLLAISLAVFLWNQYRLKAKRNQELRILNAELERRVEERTKRMREEIEQRRIAQEQAELANDTKNRFLATISHEVRTPINAIIGFCDLTIKSDIEPKHQENLKRVKDSSEHLLALVKDVLDYSQIESGTLELKNSTFDIKKLIESVSNAFYLDASSKEINISYKIAENIPKYVIGDSDILRQVLYNLVGNAIKFTDKGDVTISVNLDEKLESDKKIKLKFSVNDTGIGISKLKQKLVFMDFTQVDNSSSRRYGGAGLGLTLSKHFVELMGGKISVESEKGKGSNFMFTIILEEDKQKSIKPSPEKSIEKKKLHILVAEDNLLNAHVVGAFLKRLGHTSKVAGNGLEALEKLAKEDFDAVLMDIEMPEMDGIEATEAIREGKENVRNPKIPVIALTAHALKDYEEKSFKAGMNNYLTKPVDIEKLSEVLQAV